MDKVYNIGKFLYLIIAILLHANNCYANNKNVQDRNSWFSVVEVAGNVYCIDEHGKDNIYLVAGTEKALLIDTGRGVSDLKTLIKSLTDLPIIVVNTHGHGDHCGGNFQFDSVYMHPADFEMVNKYVTKERIMHSSENYSKKYPELTEYFFHDYSNYNSAELIPVREGDIFDLGGRTLEVIETPGHTRGCICLLDKENKLLFSGDNNCVHIWLFMETSSPVEGYLESLKKLMSYSEQFDIIMPGHEEPMGTDYLDEVLTCVNNILSGNCDPQPYQSFGDDVKCCIYKRANVVFNTNHIYGKK